MNHGGPGSRIPRPRPRQSAAAAALVAVTMVMGYAYWTGIHAGRARSAAELAFSGGAAATALQKDFAAAANEFHVPENVLLAVSYHETLWESHDGQPSTTGNYNVMGLTQVTPAGLAAPTAAQRRAALDQRGKGGAFHPSAAALSLVGSVPTGSPALHTLDAAAKLAGQPAAELRTSMRQSARGGAALLAAYERAAVGTLPSDPGQWYAAVARYSQAPDTRGAELFADRVYATIRHGAARITSDGQAVTLQADPSVTPQRSSIGTLGLSADTASAPAPQCPSGLSCNFIPAAYAQTSSGYGNFDLANRPSDGDAIRYIVVHDTEGSYSGTVSEFQNASAEVSAHYVIRSSDGLVTQMVPTSDVAWHAGNWYMNMHAIGIEHEGFALQGATWYTENEYESSAALVRYLAGLYNIPLDRQHVIGHDDVPGPTQSLVAGMHWDPGPFWNWDHYLSLIGAPIGQPRGGIPLVGGKITINPPFTSANEPTVTSCSSSCQTLPAQPANFVYLRTSPSAAAPLLSDPAIHPDGSAGTTNANDWGDKAVEGQTFIVAAEQSAWTAVWYAGTKAWFYNPGGANAVPDTQTSQLVITPRAGVTSIPVYGRAYPEASAYPSSIMPQPLVPLQYTIPAGQAYVPATSVTGDFYNTSFVTSASGNTLVTGSTSYYPIRYNHRLGYVIASDVQLVPSAAATIAAGAEGSDGALWARAPQLGAGWHSLGGKIIAAPAVAAPPNPDGGTPARPLFVATGTNHALYIRSLSAGWQLLGPSSASCLNGPAAVITGTSTLTMACEGLDRALWVNTATVPVSGLPQVTSAWTRLGGVLADGPAAAPVGATMTYFVLGTNGQIFTRTNSTGYTGMPWRCIGRPAAAARPVSGGTVFACQGGNHALWESADSGAGWAPAVSLGGSLIGGPAVAAASRVTAVLAEGTDHAAWMITLSGSDWVSLGGSIVGGIGAVGLD